jgi:hypothetical protein
MSYRKIPTLKELCEQREKELTYIRQEKRKKILNEHRLKLLNECEMNSINETNQHTEIIIFIETNHKESCDKKYKQNKISININI